MTKQKRLKLMGAADAKLGHSTVMDRALAQKYGALYVHTAAFAIDVDRVHRASPEDDPALPFGWDVALTDLYLCTFVSGHAEALGLLDDLVLSVIDLTSAASVETAPLGSQLPFAVFSALERQALPPELHMCFRSWKKPPLALARDVARFLQDAKLMAGLCEHCLAADVAPPLVQPVRDALSAMKLARPPA